MRRHIIILIALWSGLLGAWAFANPPTGTPGTTTGIISSNTTGDIGIAAGIPATALDVNGTTTIRKSLDMTNNRILNVVTPTSSLDAANKAYVDAQIAGVTSSTAKVWGQGRPGTAVISVAGECTRVISGATVKISRSTRPASWDKAPAACPAGWWTCSAADRGAAACGSGNRTYVLCDMTQSPTENYADDFATNPLGVNTNRAWVSDAGTTTNEGRGGLIATTGLLEEITSCNLFPVWCCAYQ